jgi:uncharacterized protein YecE (DUF72 family)
LAILIGTSGWSYQEWVGPFYPNDRVAKLPFYSRVFDSVEVDSSFFKPPSKSMAAGWTKATNSSFKFSLRLPRTIGENLSLFESEFEVFARGIEPIRRAGRLGCLLLQLPPGFTFKRRSDLESCFELLPSDIHFAVEFRHHSWDRRETWELLQRFNVACAITDSPIGFPPRPIVTSTTHSYIRWDGRGKSDMHDYRYSERELLVWQDRLAKIETQVPFVYAYFSNYYGGSAPSNILALLELGGELSDHQRLALRRDKRFQKTRRSGAKLTDFM